VQFGETPSQTREIYDNHDVFNLENLYWESSDEVKINDTENNTPIIPLKKVFLRNVNNKRRRIFR
jgi:hypothetical protein